VKIFELKKLHRFGNVLLYNPNRISIDYRYNWDLVIFYFHDILSMEKSKLLQKYYEMI